MSRILIRSVLLVVFALLVSCDRQSCAIGDHPANGTYEAYDATPSSLLGAEVTVDGSDVTIRYTLEDGSTWEARYKVTDAYTY